MCDFNDNSSFWGNRSCNDFDDFGGFSNCNNFRRGFNRGFNNALANTVACANELSFANNRCHRCGFGSCSRCGNNFFNNGCGFNNCGGFFNNVCGFNNWNNWNRCGNNWNWWNNSPCGRSCHFFNTCNFI